MFCDMQVQSTAEYVTGEMIDFTVPGRGGTAFAPAFEWFNENSPDISGLIYFTDLECDDFGPEPAYPVLWAGHSDPLETRELHARMANVPFGDCIELIAE